MPDRRLTLAVDLGGREQLRRFPLVELAITMLALAGCGADRPVFPQEEVPASGDSVAAINRSVSIPEGPRLDALRAELCELDSDCCAYDGEPEPRQISEARLGTGQSIYILECMTFGYNREGSVFIKNEDGTVERARFGPWPLPHDKADGSLFPIGPDEVSWLTTPYFEGTLNSVYCVRGICDAGTSVEYRWDGELFQVARIRGRDDDCCSTVEGYDRWPIVWPDGERCGYRWEVSSAGVVLVAIDGAHERRTSMDGLPRDCDVGSNGALLMCGYLHHPVTAEGEDWVVWAGIDPVDEPLEPRRLARVPRGCGL